MDKGKMKTESQVIPPSEYFTREEIEMIEDMMNSVVIKGNRNNQKNVMALMDSVERKMQVWSTLLPIEHKSDPTPQSRSLPPEVKASALDEVKKKLRKRHK